MKASDFVAEFLMVNGVKIVTEMCGGMTTHLLDSLAKCPEIHVVSMHHEQGAAFAAEGVARMTGQPGVAMATSGPGATNLLTGVGSCYFDSVPTVFITGQVNTNELRGASGVRQAGFQETDIVALAAPITKGAWQVASAEDIPAALERAFCLALEGRPGPVLLDIPMNVQRAELDATPAKVRLPPRLAPGHIDDALSAVLTALRPVIIAGGGIRTARAADAFGEFAQRAHVPVVATLMGADAIAFDHPEHVGLIGSYGNRWANLAMAEADCLLVLGARLDVRQTGADVEAFRAGKTLVRVDIDVDQLSWRVGADVSITADLGEFLASALEYLNSHPQSERSQWHARIVELIREWPPSEELAHIEGINPADLLRAVGDIARDAVAFITDVGQNQMWSAQSLRLRSGQRLLTSGGMGAMGFALPTAIGAALAAPGTPIVMIAGDGGMQVNIQELETVARLGLPLKMLVLNNRCLGMVRQFQDDYFDSRYQSTVWGYGAPDFAAVSEAYGVPSRAISSSDEIDDALAWLFADGTAPSLLEVRLPQTTCVRPKVSFGNPVYVMDPRPERDKHDG